MREVDQTRTYTPDGPPGNCWSACIASILDLDLEQVPDELTHWKPGMRPIESWRPFEKEMHRWLYSRGYVLIQTSKLNKFEYCGPEDCYSFYHIVSGKSPRADFLHAVVGLGLEIVHDPHPSRDGLAGDPDDWCYEMFMAHLTKR